MYYPVKKIELKLIILRILSNMTIDTPFAIMDAILKSAWGGFSRNFIMLI